MKHTERNVKTGIALFYSALWLAALALSLVSPQIITCLTEKEGPLEHVTHAVLLLAVIWHFTLWLREKVKREHLFLALLCFVFFLEEVNYFQVYFDFTTPDWIRNFTGRSDHLNFHNTRAADYLIPGFYAFYFLVLPVYGNRKRFSGKLRNVGLTPLTVTFAAAFFFNAVVSFLVEHFGPGSIDSTELFDLTVAILLFFMALWRRYAFQKQGPDGRQQNRKED